MSRSRGLSISMCETIQKFIEASTKEEVSALQDVFESQADLMRRQERDESAAFWEALAIGVAHAAARSDLRGGP